MACGHTPGEPSLSVSTCSLRPGVGGKDTGRSSAGFGCPHPGFLDIHSRRCRDEQKRGTRGRIGCAAGGYLPILEGARKTLLFPWQRPLLLFLPRDRNYASRAVESPRIGCGGNWRRKERGVERKRGKQSEQRRSPERRKRREKSSRKRAGPSCRLRRLPRTAPTPTSRCEANRQALPNPTQQTERNNTAHQFSRPGPTPSRTLPAYLAGPSPPIVALLLLHPSPEPIIYVHSL